jgi:hypothetical protein
MISFARPEQIRLASGICQSFCLDNGAFSVWRRKAKLDTRLPARIQGKTAEGTKEIHKEAK